MWRAHPTNRRASDGGEAGWEGGCPVISKPEQCDHSPVQLPPMSKRKRRCYQEAAGGKKLRWKKGEGRGSGTGSEVFQEQKKLEDRHPHHQQQQPQQQPDAVRHWSAGEVTDYPTGGDQPDAEAERLDARGDQLDPRSKTDGKAHRADTTATGSPCREGGCSEMPDSSDGAAASGHGDAGVAKDAGEEIDAAIMAAMGFSEFGRSR